MAINDVLPGPQETSDLISMVVFTFAMRRHLIWIASGPFTSFHLAKFGWVPFADLRVQCLAVKQNTEFTEGARKLWSYFNPFVDESL